MSDESIKSLLHFDDGLQDAAGIQTWSKTTDGVVIDTTQVKFGAGSLYPNGGYMIGTNYSGIWDLNSSGEYEIEFFVYPIAHGGTRYLFQLTTPKTDGGDGYTFCFRLSLNTAGTLRFASDVWGYSNNENKYINGTTVLSVNTWSHVMIRIKDETLKVYLNGAEEITAALPENVTIKEQQVRLGYFSDTAYAFYMDEFVFRHSAGTDAPTVPTEAYSGEWPTAPLPSILTAKGIKSLLHFYSFKDEVQLEGWSRSSTNVTISTTQTKFGSGSLYPNGGYMIGTNYSGIWDLNSSGEYEIEFFVYPIAHGGTRYLFQLTTPKTDGTSGYTYYLRLSLDSSGKLVFACKNWGYSEADNPITGTTALTKNTWSHIVLRIAEQKVIVYTDGNKRIEADLPENVVITPTQARLGYFNSTTYAFYMDEFVFRYGLGGGENYIPTTPYFINLATSNRRDWGDIKSLMHFERSSWDEVGLETWETEGACRYENSSFSKFGDYYLNLSSVYVLDSENSYTNYGSLRCNNSSGIFTLSPAGSYEFEFFTRINSDWMGGEGNVLKLSHEDGSGNEVVDLALKYSLLEEVLVEGDEETGEGYEYRYTEHVRLISDTWAINADHSKVEDYDWTATLERTPGMEDYPICEFSPFMDAAYHIDKWVFVVVRVSAGQVKLYINGTEYLSGTISTNSMLTPDTVRIGGVYDGVDRYWSMYVDEFVFRHSAGTGNPVIPAKAYGLETMAPRRDFGDIKSLVHFDFPYYNEPNDGLDDEVRGAVWGREGNTKLAGVEIPYEYEGAPKFGYRCAYYPDDTSYIRTGNLDGVFTVSPSDASEAECFVKVAEDTTGDILSLERVNGNNGQYAVSKYEAEGYAFYNGHTFKYFSEYKTWTEAKAACEDMGGHLATSTSAEKNTFLGILHANTYIWLGGTYDTTKGTWSWITGEEWSYTNWQSGQPSYSNPEYTVLRLIFSPSNKWDNINPDNAYKVNGYICEWDYDIREAATFSNILALSIANNGALALTSSAWSIDSTSTLTLSADTWHHILLRLANHTAKVYLDGVLAISAPITGSTEIAPNTVKLGGYVGFMDEFVFRDSAGTKAPVVPAYPYRGRVNNSSVGGYGTGADGDVVISADTQINSYGIISSIEDVHTLTVSSWSNGSVVPAVGTEVMIHITAPKSTEGAEYPLVGLYAFSEISAIDGTTIALTDKIARGSGFDFNLDSSLLNTYYVQVITVPNYASLTVDSGKKITPLTWSNTKGGGIVAFRCTGDCTINGSIITHGYGATRYDLQQMTNAKLIDRFLCGSGGGIFITCGGTFTAPSTARLGASYSGLGDGNNGAAGYGGNGGSNNVTSGGLGGVGGGGGGATRNNGNSITGGDCGKDGNNATGGSGGGGCGGRGGRGNKDNLAGGGGGGQGGSGGVIEGLNASTSVGHIPQAGTINGGNHGDVANGAYQSGAGGGGPGGNGGDGSWYISGSDTGTLKGGSAGASIILIVEALKADIATFSTGGSAGTSKTSTSSSLRTGGGGGGGTGFCYIACREQVSENA